MNSHTEKLYRKYWATHPHPYRQLESLLHQNIKSEMNVLEHGCGRTAPLLTKFLDSGCNLYGVDLVDFRVGNPAFKLVKADISNVPFEDAKFDLVFSRSVMEHVEKPLECYRETYRVLKNGGRWIFLTPNRWDYVSIISRSVPNRFHGKLVKFAEGREEEDVFPVVYKSNSWGQIHQITREVGFKICRLDYLGQHPSYLGFNSALYLLGTGYEKMLLATEYLRRLRGWMLVMLEKPEV